MLTFGSLFSGIGGIDLGFERAGLQCKWQVEIDPYAQKVLAKHWPNVARFGDIRECGSHNLESVDVIAGGFPCQPHSLAGKRRASHDERDLWSEFARVAMEVRPRHIVGENVLGLLSSEKGQFFGRVLKDLADIGYDAEWHCLPASAFGAPHIRKRIFMLCRDTNYKPQATVGAVSRHADTEPSRNGNDVANAISERAGVERRSDCGQERGSAYSPESTTLRQAYWAASSGWVEPSGDLGGQLPNAYGTYGEGNKCPVRIIAKHSIPSVDSWWEVEPAMGELVNGLSGGLVRFAGRATTASVPNRSSKLRGLGNAVVPAVAQYIARHILEHAQ